MNQIPQSDVKEIKNAEVSANLRNRAHLVAGGFCPQGYKSGLMGPTQNGFPLQRE